MISINNGCHFEKIQASDSLIPNTPSLFAYIILFMQVIFT